MAIELTERAANHILNQARKEGRSGGVRLGVRTSGCSGFMYTVDYDDAPDPEDVVEEQRGVTVIVSRKSLPFLEGMVVDFVRDGINQRLSFENPNVKEACGCGESFTV